MGVLFRFSIYSWALLHTRTDIYIYICVLRMRCVCVSVSVLVHVSKSIYSQRMFLSVTQTPFFCTSCVQQFHWWYLSFSSNFSCFMQHGWQNKQILCSTSCRLDDLPGACCCGILGTGPDQHADCFEEVHVKCKSSRATTVDLNADWDWYPATEAHVDPQNCLWKQVFLNSSNLRVHVIFFERVCDSISYRFRHTGT